MGASRFTLATDLDGTLLAGSPERRAKLVSILVDAQTIFVTGCALESVRPLLHDPALPRPAFIIADVGATVVDGGSLQPVQPIQSRIEQAWPGRRRVLDALARSSTLVRQAVPQERRCSCYVEDPSSVTAEIVDIVRKLGCDLLLGDRFLEAASGRRA